MKSRLKLGMFIVLSVLAVGCGIFFWPTRLIDARSTYAIAQSVFIDLARYYELEVNDFEPPPPLNEVEGARLVMLEWRSKRNADCRIQVDVDRKVPNARPMLACPKVKK